MTVTYPPPYLTTAEVASELRVTARTVQRWIASGRLPYRRVGGRVRIHPAWLSAVDSGDPVLADSQTASAAPVLSTNPGASGSDDSRGYSR